MLEKLWISNYITHLVFCCLDLLIRNRLKIISCMEHELIVDLLIDIEGDVNVDIWKQLVSWIKNELHTFVWSINMGTCSRNDIPCEIYWCFLKTVFRIVILGWLVLNVIEIGSVTSPKNVGTPLAFLLVRVRSPRACGAFMSTAQLQLKELN